ncbi:hypothetical protein J4Q44_G00383790 [Coregonus suidteri]|uniref:Uncharacterized protein n=1 Tax=Coregonus suidteri TaxID=861788 RepID=A0AAN8KLE8_9TELE
MQSSSAKRGARVNAKDNKWLTPLHRAVASCSEEAVQVLLKHSTDVNARDKNWQTPLHIAAANKAVRCAEALVPLLSNVNVSDRAGRTALHHAAFSGHQEMVRLLLSRGANINAFDKKDRAIHWAAYMGHIEVVKLLASHGSEVSCKDKKAYTPLHSAASSGMISVVKYLLDLGVDDVVVNELIECGANVNQVNEKGFAPLHFTAASRHGALCLELLVGNGALVNIKSRCMSGFVCLDRDSSHSLGGMANANMNRCLRFGHSSSCCYMCHARHSSCRVVAGHIEVVKLLASHGSEVSSCKRQEMAYTPLHSAASSGMIMWSVYEKGLAPLHFTAASRHGVLCLELLVGNGALVNIKSKDGKTPLHMTAIHGRFSRSQAIIQNGEASMGSFTLHLSALSGFSDCCRKLLSSGFDIDTPDDFGRTCLHAAAAVG